MLRIARYDESAHLLAMKIALGSDHAGFAYKEKIKRHLITLGHEVKDFGTESDAAVDYPLYIRPAAESVARGESERGIVLGGSGNGEAIVANKVRGVRCALCWSEQTAIWGRQHNNANVLAIGERTLAAELALKIVDLFLATPFEGGRHLRRVEQIE
jgi:ribose 5-phosphate isomerase B